MAMKFMSALVVRPRMAIAMGLGVATSAGLSVLAHQLRLSSILVSGWDVFSAGFVGLMLKTMLGDDQSQIRARAARDDEGRAAVLTIVLIASVAALAATGVELSQAKAVQGWDKALHIALAFVTVVASWAMVQMIFAVHYAHGYYSRNFEGAGGKADAGGLLFPGKQPPDYWDFVHFSVVIGVASQTADVQFTSKGMRRLGTVHSLAAFAFNTVIVALTINLLAGLF